MMVSEACPRAESALAPGLPLLWIRALWHQDPVSTYQNRLTDGASGTGPWSQASLEFSSPTTSGLRE